MVCFCRKKYFPCHVNLFFLLVSRRSLAHVSIPSMTMNVPPSPEVLGIRAEAALNCETLGEDPGLELRWGNSIAFRVFYSTTIQKI